MPHLSPTTLTTDEQRLILRATARNLRDHTIISLALGTGLRLGVTTDEAQRIVGATRAARQGWRVEQGHQFFLCDGFQPTSFRKTTPGGLFGHRYFDLVRVLGGPLPRTLDDIAAALRNKSWE